MAFDISKKKAFVCDLDGTLFMGPHPMNSVPSRSQTNAFFFEMSNAMAGILRARARIPRDP